MSSDHYGDPSIPGGEPPMEPFGSPDPMQSPVLPEETFAGDSVDGEALLNPPEPPAPGDSGHTPEPPTTPTQHDHGLVSPLPSPEPGPTPLPSPLPSPEPGPTPFPMPLPSPEPGPSPMQSPEPVVPQGLVSPEPQPLPVETPNWFANEQAEHNATEQQYEQEDNEFDQTLRDSP